MVFRRLSIQWKTLYLSLKWQMCKHKYTIHLHIQPHPKVKIWHLLEDIHDKIKSAGIYAKGQLSALVLWLFTWTFTSQDCSNKRCYDNELWQMSNQVFWDLGPEVTGNGQWDNRSLCCFHFDNLVFHLSLAGTMTSWRCNTKSLDTPLGSKGNWSV